MARLPIRTRAWDAFVYSLNDGFGGTDTARATILLNATPDVARPTAPTLMTITDESTAAGEASVFAARVNWLASSDDTQVLGYNIYRNGELVNSLADTSAPGSMITYTDTAVLPDAAYTYRITAIDTNSESGLSDPGTVTVVTSLRQNIQTGWGDGTDSLWGRSRCTGCHRGAPGGLTLRGAAADVFAEVMEDQGDAGTVRADRDSPLASLLLCKPLLEAHPRGCAHGGGHYLVASDPAYQMLQRWIEAGVPNN